MSTVAVTAVLSPENATPHDHRLRAADRPVSSLFQRVLPWVLLAPLIYLLVEGITSFQVSGNGGYGGMQENELAFQAKSVPLAVRVVTTMMWAICAFGIVTKFKRILTIALEMKAISGLALLTMVSCVWSEDAQLTFFKSVLFVAGTLFAYYFTERFTPDEQMEILYVLGLIILVASVAISVALPQDGVDITGAWRGLFNHKNRLCRGVMLMLPPAIALRPKGVLRLLRIPFFLMAFGLIILAQARTGWVITGAYFGLYVFLRLSARVRKRDLVTMLMIGGGFATYAVYFLWTNFAVITRGLGKDPTLSGRTDLWQAVIASGLKQPLLGYGFGAFWRGVQGESVNIFLATGFAVAQGHNAYLDMWLDLGFLGLGLFLITFINACKDAYACFQPNRPREIDWYIGTIFIIVSLGMTQGQLLVHNSLAILLYFISCIGLHKARKQIVLRQGTVLQPANSMNIQEGEPAFDPA